MSEDKEQNFDHMRAAISLMNTAQNDMIVCINRGKVNDGVKERMIKATLAAVKELQKIRTPQDGPHKPFNRQRCHQHGINFEYTCPKCEKDISEAFGVNKIRGKEWPTE